MSSYADIAKHGPEQADEDKKAHAVPQLNDHSTVDTKDVTVDDQSINVVPADYREREVKTESQAAQHNKDAALKEDAKARAKEAEKKAKEVAKKTENVLLALGKDGRTYNLINSIVLVTLGVVGYRRYKEGRLDLQTVSIGVAGLGLFAGAQGWIQSWFKRQ